MIQFTSCRVFISNAFRFSFFVNANWMHFVGQKWLPKNTNFSATFASFCLLEKENSNEERDALDTFSPDFVFRRGETCLHFPVNPSHSQVAVSLHFGFAARPTRFVECREIIYKVNSPAPEKKKRSAAVFYDRLNFAVRLEELENDLDGPAAAAAAGQSEKVLNSTFSPSVVSASNGKC